MATFPDDPWAGKRTVTPPRGPRIIKSSADDPAAQPGGGMTLDALMARQQELAGNKVPMTDMQSPMQGISYALQQGLQGFQQGRAAKDISTGQQAVGNALASLGPDGQLTPEGKAALAQYSPDTFLQLWAMQQQKAKTEQWTQIPTPEGENGQWFQNQNGETKKVGGGNPGESGWKPSDLGTLRDDYSNAAKVYETAAPRWQTMKEAAKVAFAEDGGVKGGADYNMIVGFAKLLDPNSVVRETEVDSATNLGGKIDAVKGWLNTWKINGGKLDPEIRRSIMQQSQSLMQGYYDQVKQKHSWISDIATRHGQDPRDVVPPLAEFQGWGEDTSDDPPPAERD